MTKNNETRTTKELEVVDAAFLIMGDSDMEPELLHVNCDDNDSTEMVFSKEENTSTERKINDEAATDMVASGPDASHNNNPSSFFFPPRNLCSIM